MKLVRDILDKQLVDCNGRNMGKVDGIVVNLREGKPPRIAYLEVGSITLSCRISRKLSGWVQKCYSFCPAAGAFRIPFSKVRDISVDLRVDLEADKTDALAVERWWKEKIIKRIPGA
jgi:sporulation protein YlmC with PRC-barrel domain